MLSFLSKNKTVLWVIIQTSFTKSGEAVFHDTPISLWSDCWHSMSGAKDTDWDESQLKQYDFATEPIPRLSISDPEADRRIASGVRKPHTYAHLSPRTRLQVTVTSYIIAYMS